MPRRFEGKVAVVTGGASGIGLATASRLLDEGAVVGVWDVRPGEQVDALVATHGAVRVIPAAVDVRDKPAVAAAVTRLVEAAGGLDILVNNAGVTYGYLDALRVPDQAWQNVMETNVTGALNCAQAAVPVMATRGGGRIINLSSIFAEHGYPGQSAYAASKSAVVALTRVWAREFASRGITVNAVSPGYIDTPMNDKNSADFVKLVLFRTPLKRLGRPADVAAVIAFLASDEASFITGVVLPVDGGLTP